MKRLIISIFFVVILSSCRSEGFTYGDSHMDLEIELASVLERMLDEGNYNADLRVQYDKVKFAIDYNYGNVLVENIQFSVFSRFTKEDEALFYRTMCHNIEGTLECKKEKEAIVGEKNDDDLFLTDAIELYSNIDFEDIIHELRIEYSINPSASTVLTVLIVLPSDIPQEEDRFSSRVYYYENEYHYDSEYVTTDMMLEIRVYFVADSGSSSHVIYYEID